MRPILSIAGLDPSGGAGLAADARVIRAHGYHPCVVATALTAQGETGLSWWAPVPVDGVLRQVASVLVGSPLAAIKIGMIGAAALVEPLAEALRPYGRGPVVLDPVLAASDGPPLFDGGLAELMPLVQLADVITPNLAEASLLTGQPVTTLPEMRAAARRLRDLGARAALVKGGHLGADPVDVLHDGVQLHEFVEPRVEGGDARGTGCALSSAIACQLAAGRDLPDAVSAAKRYVAEALRQAYGLGGRKRYLP